MLEQIVLNFSGGTPHMSNIPSSNFLWFNFTCKIWGGTSKLKRVKTPPGNTQEILSASRQGGVEKINRAVLIGKEMVSCVMQLQALNLLDNKIIGC